MSGPSVTTGQSLREEFGRPTLLSSGRGKRFLQYLTVGLVGLGINEGGLFLVTGVFGLSYVVGGAVGRVASISANYVLNDAWTWRGRGGEGVRRWGWRGVKYVGTRVVGMGIGLTALVVLVEVGGLHYLVANVLAIGVGVLWGFGASELWVWPTRSGRQSSPGRLSTAVRTRLPTTERATWAVLALSAAMFVAFTAYTTLLYEAFWLTGADFGSYVHMFASTLDGQGFLDQGKYRLSHPSGSYWGAHFSATLLVFLPVFALAPSPITLLVLKSLLLAGSVPALWLVARTHIESDRIAGLLVASYALNPFLWSAWIFDFQEQALLPVLVFGAFYAYATDRYRLFVGLFALVLLTNEFMVLIMGGALLGLFVAAYRAGRVQAGLGGGDDASIGLAGTYRATRSRGRVPGELRVFAVAGLLLVAVKLLAGLVIARFSQFTGIPASSIALPIRELFVGHRVGMGELLLTVLGNPAVIVDAATIDPAQKVLYFVAFLAPVLFLALYDEIAVGALLPFLGFAWFLSGRPIYYQFGAHYPLYLLPFVYIGAARVIGRYSVPSSLPGGGRFRRLLTRLFVLILVLNVVGGVSLGVERQAVPATDDHTQTLSAAIESIPEDASLVTQNNIYPHVATRPHATYVTRPGMFDRYQDAYGTVSPEYVLYDRQLNSRSVDWSHAVRVAFGDRLSEEYGLYRYEDGIYVYKRGYDGLPHGITAEYAVDRRYEAGDLRVADGRLEDGRIRATRSPATTARNIWFGPYATLPPGTYTATVRVNVSRANASAESEPVVLLNVATEHNARVIARESVASTDGYEDVTLSFTLDRPTSGVEFRGAWADAAGTVSLESVSVALRRAVDERYEASEFGVTDGRRKDGLIRATSSAASEGRNIWFGPYVALPPGTYTATFRVNVSRANTSTESDPVVLLNVATERNARVIARESVRATDGWENVTLTFTLDRPTSGVEFRGVRGGGAGSVDLESVSVETRNASTSG